MRKTFVGLKCLDHPGKEVPEFLIKEKTAGTDLMEQVREVIPAVSAREGLITHQIFFQPGAESMRSQYSPKKRLAQKGFVSKY